MTKDRVVTETVVLGGLGETSSWTNWGVAVLCSKYTIWLYTFKFGYERWSEVPESGTLVSHYSVKVWSPSVWYKLYAHLTI